jgi:response regulator RpfG family c-di-GMP phosphodiesterase
MEEKMADDAQQTSVAQHCILCVDDEPNILNALKRLLRKENYRILTANSGAEGLALLEKNNVHLVISDHRMPEMTGTEFFKVVKEKYPDIIRITLTGYTEVDAITDAINKGHIYKFFLKPWNDHNLKLEIRQALEQYELYQVNKQLHEKVIQQNEELITMNNNLEEMVRKRTREIEIKNQALELSHAVLEDIPVCILGISLEGMVVLANRMARELSFSGEKIVLGMSSSDYFPEAVEKEIQAAISNQVMQHMKECDLAGDRFRIGFIPLSGRFRGKGIVIAMERIQTLSLAAGSSLILQNGQK